MSKNIDQIYLELLQDILDNGYKKGDRTGTGTISTFGKQIKCKISDGFPLITTKKMHYKGIITELLWFLRGDTNIKYLVDNGCNIWNGDAYKSYLSKYSFSSNPMAYKEDIIENGPCDMTEFIYKIKNNIQFANTYGELGPIYGKQWVDWGGKVEVSLGNNKNSAGHLPFITEHKKGINQIQILIDELKTNPDSRRLMVNAWNVSELKSMVLPPCHYGFQVWTRELSEEERVRLIMFTGMDALIPEARLKWMNDNNIPKREISLMFNMRSNDVPLGLPYNIASYGLLLEIIGKMVNMVPGELTCSLGDCHIYLNQIDGIKEQLTRTPFSLPKLKHLKTDEFYKDLGNNLSLIKHLDIDDFLIEDYQSHPPIKLPLSN